jgi:hypothetical protein
MTFSQSGKNHAICILPVAYIIKIQAVYPVYGTPEYLHQEIRGFQLE